MFDVYIPEKVRRAIEKQRDNARSDLNKLNALGIGSGVVVGGLGGVLAGIALTQQAKNRRRNALLGGLIGAGLGAGLGGGLSYYGTNDRRRALENLDALLERSNNRKKHQRMLSPLAELF